MNPYKNISVMRDQKVIPFSEKDEYMKSQLAEVELLKQENDRLQHLTTVLIDHIWKKYPFPLKDIDRQMELYDKENNV